MVSKVNVGCRAQRRFTFGASAEGACPVLMSASRAAERLGLKTACSPDAIPRYRAFACIIGCRCIDRCSILTRYISRQDCTDELILAKADVVKLCGKLWPPSFGAHPHSSQTPPLPNPAFSSRTHPLRAPCYTLSSRWTIRSQDLVLTFDCCQDTAASAAAAVESIPPRQRLVGRDDRSGIRNGQAIPPLQARSITRGSTVDMQRTIDKLNIRPAGIA